MAGGVEHRRNDTLTKTATVDESEPLSILGRVRSPFTEKFGVPRQPGLVPSAPGELLLLPPYNRPEMVYGLERFSHVWLIFMFHQAVNDGWKPVVRPPRLGGREKVGVFASRSPHRPNHLGLSSVRLTGIVCSEEGVKLQLAGVDLVDGTPVVDIKPYLPYSDVHAAARDGFAGAAISPLMVRFSLEAAQFCQDYDQRTGRNLYQLISECLAGDPRPPSQRQDGREFGMTLWDVNIRWRAGAEGVTVTYCQQLRADQSR